MFRRAWGRAPVPVWGVMSGLHVWFYRINKNILPLSYGEVWAAQICPVAQMHRANDFCLRIYYEDQYLFTDWQKSAELQPAASQRRATAAGQHRNAAAPRAGGRSCRQRLRLCSELLGRPRGAALSARPLRNRLRSGVTQDGRQRRHLGVSAARRHPCGCAGLPELAGDCGDVCLRPAPQICC